MIPIPEAIVNGHESSREVTWVDNWEQLLDRHTYTSTLQVLKACNTFAQTQTVTGIFERKRWPLPGRPPGSIPKM